MTKEQIKAASIETLNARKEALVNARGIESVQRHKEWHELAAEVESRKGYASYSLLVDAYTNYLSGYAPTASASDGE